MTTTVQSRSDAARPTAAPPTAVTAPRRAGDDAAAALLEPVVRALLGDAVPLRFDLWDGSAFGPESAAGSLRITSPDAIRRIVWAPSELGLARAYVAGELDFDGDIYAVLTALRDNARRGGRVGAGAMPPILNAARGLGALRRPPPAPAEEARSRGHLHSKSRDRQAISHHYDVGNDFYELVLGPAMTYSCARFAEPGTTLADAQAAKHELICRKLGLHERSGARLLDVGCGWGSLAMHAAAHHGATVVGVTISAEQAARARARVEEAGLSDQVEIRLQDYRDMGGEVFDAISSVGMFEHVGSERTAEYFTKLHDLLPGHGRLLNHAISSPGGSRLGNRSFLGRYVFPDGELLDVGDTVLAMERAGFEVRDVESLREHYARTLRAWVANLERRWDEAVALVGVGRARVWRLYMAASVVGFEDGGIGLHQALGVKLDPAGGSGMPSTRRDWG
ncbi:MAG: cyclopropane-fatty-acyl-phospholipid synthase [Acidimicrobiaceae bacterium]|jgi:cyclopropane-fatty-acyl-phospholipid synthase